MLEFHKWEGQCFPFTEKETEASERSGSIPMSEKGPYLPPDSWSTFWRPLAPSSLSAIITLEHPCSYALLSFWRNARVLLQFKHTQSSVISIGHFYRGKKDYKWNAYFSRETALHGISLQYKYCLKQFLFTSWIILKKWFVFFERNRDFPPNIPSNYSDGKVCSGGVRGVSVKEKSSCSYLCTFVKIWFSFLMVVSK